MSDIKTKAQGLDSNVRARNMTQMVQETGNIYETLNIIAKRAKQLAVEVKQELHGKLEEFAISSDAIEEINENKEQIEISKFYERLPNPVIIATDEYLKGSLYHRYNEVKKKGEFSEED